MLRRSPRSAGEVLVPGWDSWMYVGPFHRAVSVSEKGQQPFPFSWIYCKSKAREARPEMHQWLRES